MPLIKAHIQKHIGFGKKNGFTVKSGKKISGRSEGPILFGTNVFFYNDVRYQCCFSFYPSEKMMRLLQLSARDQPGPGSALSSFIQVATCCVEDKARPLLAPGWVLVYPGSPCYSFARTAYSCQSAACVCVRGCCESREYVIIHLKRPDRKTKRIWRKNLTGLLQKIKLLSCSDQVSRVRTGVAAEAREACFLFPFWLLPSRAAHFCCTDS